MRKCTIPKMKLLVLSSVFLGVVSAYNQTVMVKGITICEKYRLPDVTVELWERDIIGSDDLLATVQSNTEGVFEFSGSESERTAITPFIRFKHNCHVKNEGCVRTTEYEIPRRYINSEDAYDMTFINFDIYSQVDYEKC